MAPGGDKDAGAAVRSAGRLSFSSLPFIKGPSNTIKGPSNKIGGALEKVVGGPKDVVRVGKSLKVNWYKDALVTSTKSVCKASDVPEGSQWKLTNDVLRVPDLPPGHEWRLTNEAREDLFRPKPKDEPPVDAASVPSPSPAASTAVTSPAPTTAPAPAGSSAASSSSAAAASSPPAPAPAPAPAARVGAGAHSEVDGPRHRDSVPKEPPNADESVPPEKLGDGGGFGVFGGGGRREKAYDWIRFNNEENARSLRRQISKTTRQAVAAGGYIKGGKQVKIRRVNDMMRDTKRIAPSLNNARQPDRSAPYSATKMNYSKELALDAATTLIKNDRDYRGSNSGIAVVSAASSYHCGGAFLTGGRHALEEAMCVQTTLHCSIELEEEKAIKEREGSASRYGFTAYIPEDGVVLSPKVEIIRHGSNHGYPFFNEPVELSAIISLGMYNKNTSMSDAPIDAPQNPYDYKEGVKQKFRSCFIAALEAGSTAVVMPDVGCGVYMNDADDVGTCLGEVLREEFWGHFKEVVLVGKPDFQSGCQDAIGDVEEKLKAAQKKAPSPRPSFAPSPPVPPAPPSRDRAPSIVSMSAAAPAPAAASPAPAAPSRALIPPVPPPRAASPRPVSPAPAPAPAPVVMRASCPFCGAINEFTGGSTAMLSCGACSKQFQVGVSAPPSSPPRPAVPPPAPPPSSHAASSLAPPAPAASARSASPTPSPRGGGGHDGPRMCKFNCGRPAKEGTLPSGRPFDTCCRRCARTKGDGSHDAECALGEVRLDGGGHGHHANDRSNDRSASPRPADGARRPLCKFGCGRQVKAGTTRSGKPWDSCCRGCAVSKGGGDHDANCDAS